MTTKVLDYFSALVTDSNSIPLTKTVLSITQDVYPDLDLQAELAAIDVLVAWIKSHIAEGMPAIQRLRPLNQFFYRELGFDPSTNDYYDPENSYLNTVLQSRHDIPISLAALLMEINQQVSLPLRGVPFPNHFLVRMSIPMSEVVLNSLTGQTLSKGGLQDMPDPYLEREGIEDPSSVPLGVLLQVATHCEIIACVLCNLEAAYLQESRWQCLLAVQQRLVILLPDSIEEVCDQGLAYTNLEYFRPTLENLGACVNARPDTADTTKLKERIPTLRATSENLG